jgi:hypothetical protein
VRPELWKPEIAGMLFLRLACEVHCGGVLLGGDERVILRTFRSRLFG